ncbi:MAG: Uma2 family endonuclease [Polyangiaceae bacterium]
MSVPKYAMQREGEGPLRASDSAPESRHELRYEGPGPLRATDISPKSRYELHDGHPIYCPPTGGDHARNTIAGAELLDTDPAVQEAGIDAGFSPRPGMLRAPDVAVGNVPDKMGWIQGVPPLAVEYAGSSQDEVTLQEKIQDLLGAGTKLVWVVRLVGPRRVEVYEPEKPVRTLGPGSLLSAPGILQNSYPVEALFDRNIAHRLTLRNLLQRQGYEDLDDLRIEGREERRKAGLAEGLRTAIRDLCEALGIAIGPEQDAALSAMKGPALDELRLRIKRERRWE